MASGEHSINSRPCDMDCSGESGSCDNMWGSEVALLGSRAESEAYDEVVDTSEEVQVRTASGRSSRDAHDADRKPHVV